jgi:hypothetical protein
MSEEIKETKPCPYCAETIQAAAVVCRYCGRDLVEKAQPASDRAALQQEVARLTGQGWQVISQAETSAQLKKPRDWSRTGLVLFVFLPLVGGCLWYPLWGVAVVGLLLVLVDYLVKQDELVFLSADQLRAAAASPAEPPRITHDGLGRTICSACGEIVHPTRTACLHCGAVFEAPAAATPAP